MNKTPRKRSVIDFPSFVLEVLQHLEILPAIPRLAEEILCLETGMNPLKQLKAV